MQTVLKDLQTKFPDFHLRVGKRGTSIQRLVGSQWVKMCVKHGSDYHRCWQCKRLRAQESPNVPEMMSIQNLLQEMKRRFPSYNLKISSRRIEGAYRIVRNYGNDPKSYRICLPHGRLFKNCKQCIGSLPTLTEGENAPVRRTAVRRLVPRKIQQTFRYMREAFPNAKLRIGPTGKAIQKKITGGNPLWVKVCAMHCKSIHSCKVCRRNGDYRTHKRLEMEPVLLGMKRRFPDYNLKLTSRLVLGEYHIVRTYKEGGRTYRVCIPHGRLYKQCTGPNGCNQHADKVRKKRNFEKKRKRDVQRQKVRKKRRVQGFTLSHTNHKSGNQRNEPCDKK